MRDYYDIYALNKTQAHNIDLNVFREAFVNTSERRGTSALICNVDITLQEIAHDLEMIALWTNYQRKFNYASDVAWHDVIAAVTKFCDAVKR